MRDIESYTINYNKPNFEDYQLKYRRKKILEILEKYKPNKILEIGCGMEPLFQYINEFDEYTVVEPSQCFYNHAVELANGDTRIKCKNVCFTSIEPKFDFIICSSLLHEVENPIDFLNEIAKSCSRETLVHINVPNSESFHRVLAKAMGLIKDTHAFSERNKIYQQHSVYNLEEICDSVAICGFEVIEKGTYFLKPFTHAQMYELIKRHIIDERVLDGLYKMTDVFPYAGSEIFINCILRG